MARYLAPLIVSGLLTACADSPTTPGLGGRTPVPTTAHADVAPTAAAPWCGAAAAFPAAAVPTGWTAVNSGNPGTGLLYDRLNAQGGGWVTVNIPGAVTSALAEIRVQYDAYHDPSFLPGASGMGRVLTLFTGSGIFQAWEGMERYGAGDIFYRSELVSNAFPAPSSSVVFSVVQRTAPYGVYRHRLTIRNGAVRYATTNLLTGVAYTSGVVPMTGMTLAGIQGLQFGAGSPDNPTWADNLTISCS